MLEWQENDKLHRTQLRMHPDVLLDHPKISS
jgi:hypothetical protein